MEYRMVHLTLETSRTLLQRSFEILNACRSVLITSKEITESKIGQTVELAKTQKQKIRDTSLYLKTLSSEVASSMHSRFIGGVNSMRYLIKKEVIHIRNSQQLQEITLQIGDNVRFVENLVKLGTMVTKRFLGSCWRKLEHQTNQNRHLRSIKNQIFQYNNKIFATKMFILGAIIRNKETAIREISKCQKTTYFIVKTNKTLVRLLLNENCKKFKHYIQLTDLEVYYSPDDSVKIKEIIIFTLKTIFPDVDFSFLQKTRDSRRKVIMAFQNEKGVNTY
jgi:hypothetical protein